ncbi:hypothetical protein, partial [Haladaptatus sp.]|uniref:hypothetical protein n=1 Tax=Haladaptatus sp. TaxID=1973141 RepID=UPI003C32AF80
FGVRRQFEKCVVQSTSDVDHTHLFVSYLNNTVARYPSQGSHNELLCISFTSSDNNIHPTSSQIVSIIYGEI